MLLDMLFALEPKARVFAIDTHHLFPETYALLARGRAALRHDDRGLRRRRPVEDGLWETKPDLYLAIAKVAPLVTRARRPRRLDHRHPPRPVADARERAEARLGRAARALEGEPARRLDRRDCWAYIRERGLPYNALHDRGYDSIGDTHSTQPGAGREGRWAGTDKHRVRHARRRRRGRMSGFVALVHRALRGRQDDGRIARRPGARAARPRRRPPRRRLVRTHLSRASATRRRTATRTSRASAGSPRALARAGAAVVVSAISPYEEARRHARALVEAHAPFVEVHVATPLEECARRDPKGLYAKAFSGEIDDFTGVSATRTRRRRTRSSGSTRPKATPAESAAERARAARGAATSSRRKWRRDA